MSQTSESAFETVIEAHLLRNGYVPVSGEGFDRDRAIFPDTVLAFIRETQPAEWDKLEALHGAKTGEQILADLCKWMDANGSLATLRHGFKCYGRTLRVAFFKAAHELNPELEARYAANRLGLTRQLRFSSRSEKSLDLTLSLNGIPVATVELKNPLTGQTVEDAIQQYRRDRDPREPVFEFKRRTLVHFAVDTELVRMTTRLAGDATHFLPFDKGSDGGAGNPPDPEGRGYRTAYLWEEVLARDSLLDVLARFVHLQTEEKRDDHGRKVKVESMIFPRYHQLEAVRLLVEKARGEGVGNNYLIEHSAGSGKSNTIGWLAHRLASLHDGANERVFDSVIVVTDRVVLDQQLQDTIYQFEHKLGVVRKIDERSRQLAEALESAVPVIITTLQKFPFVSRHLLKMAAEQGAEGTGVLPSRRCAVIVDEAHSSQGGETATDLKEVLGGEDLHEEARKRAEEEGIEEKMNAGIRQKELPEQFATQEYRVLLVAEKYQTGFDQPLLHTMYVDKRLAGIQAVQTLSRLNRTHPLKEDTFVLDFVNDPEEIREAFKVYYEGTEMGEEVDPARMYAVKGELDASGIYLDGEVERFCAVYFKPKQRQSTQDHREMNAALDPAVSRFEDLRGEDEDRAELWRGKARAFRNLYGFLSQIIPYQDSDLERLYVFLRHLAAKLPRRRSGPAYQFDDEVRLEYYRLQKISEGSISLSGGDTHALDGPTEVGSGAVHAESLPLSQLIDVVNDRFGTDFNQADQLFFDQVVEAAMGDDALRQAAAVNPEDKFELVFGNLLERIFVERMDQNEEIFVRYMNDPSFQRIVTRWMASEAYRRLRTDRDAAEEPPPEAAFPAGLRVVEGRPEERYASCLPLVPLRAAAGAFGEPQRVEEDGFDWVAVESRHRLRQGMFAAQVAGRSMEPAIPDGAWCLFRAPVEGSRQGKTVLVELRDRTDPDTGQRYTVKRYESERMVEGDSWRHSKITLKPVNPEFEAIVLTGADEGDLRVIAEFLEVIGGP